MFVTFTDWEFDGNVENAAENARNFWPHMKAAGAQQMRATVTGANSIRTMTLWNSKEECEAALKFMKKAMRRYGSPNEIVTDKLRSYSAAARELGCAEKQVTKRWANNRVENSHLPFRRRERLMLRFRRMHRLQKFASIHASFHNLFNSQRSLSTRGKFKLNRDAALSEWRSLLIS